MKIANYLKKSNTKDLSILESQNHKQRHSINEFMRKNQRSFSLKYNWLKTTKCRVKQIRIARKL